MKLSSIEEGAAIPEIVPRNNKYNFHKMEIGQQTNTQARKVRTKCC